MQPILVSCQALFRSNLKKTTGRVRVDPQCTSGLVRVRPHWTIGPIRAGPQWPSVLFILLSLPSPFTSSTVNAAALEHPAAAATLPPQN